MKKLYFLRKITTILLLAGCLSCYSNSEKNADEHYADFIVSPNDANVEFFWKDDAGEILKSIGNLKKYAEKNNKKLRFAMNGGMYQEDNKPLGLFIENQKTVTPLNTREGAKGNFYIKPNGVFYITNDGRAFVVPTAEFKTDGSVKFATQSGPMLVAGGAVNSEFTPNSDNLNIRNGVCVLPDGRILFSISRREVNFHDFAVHFQKAGCRNALYLDGFVSRMYLPEKDLKDTGGNFGVIIGVVE